MVGILEEMSASYIHSEFNWPLVVAMYFEVWIKNELANQIPRLQYSGYGKVVQGLGSVAFLLP